MTKKFSVGGVKDAVVALWPCGNPLRARGAVSSRTNKTAFGPPPAQELPQIPLPYRSLYDKKASCKHGNGWLLWSRGNLCDLPCQKFR